MAAPTYDHDLTDITLAETTTGFSAYGGGGAGLGTGADFAMQGLLCVDKQISNTDKGIYFTASAQTIGTDDHVWIWTFVATPGLTDTLQNRGSGVRVGTGTGALCEYHVDGKDTYGAVARVGRCHAIDYTARTALSRSRRFRTVTGSPGASPTIFGGGLVTTASSKAANFGLDAIRLGRGAFITAGELISAGDASDDPANFGGFAAISDALTNRLGILTRVGGSFELVGKFIIGRTTAGTATACKFRQVGGTLTAVAAPHAASDFTEIELDHASSRAEFVGTSFSGVSAHNPGQTTVTDGVLVLDGCSHSNWGPTVLDASADVRKSIWRNSGQITAAGADCREITVDSYARAPEEGGFAHDNTASGTAVAAATTTLSTIAIGTADTNRRVIVAVGSDVVANPAPVLNSATIGGVTATIHVDTATSSGGTENSMVQIISAIVPTGTTATIVLNYDKAAGGTLGYGVYAVNNCSVRAGSELSDAATALNQTVNFPVSLNKNGITISVAGNSRNFASDLSTDGLGVLDYVTSLAGNGHHASGHIYWDRTESAATVEYDPNQGWVALAACEFIIAQATTDDSALVWNVATNPSGLLDNATFVKGDEDTHAIEFGLTSPTTISLNGLTLTGYNAANAQIDSALHFKRTSGTVTLNVANMPTPSYKTDGATITVVASVQVTLTGLVNGTEVRVYDAGDGSVIAGTESVTGNQFQFNDTAGNIVDIRIFHLDYQPADLEGFTVAAGSIPINQVADRWYENPA